jgi:hypothetical protein
MELSQLYEMDETAWLEQMAQLVKEHRYSELDYENLGEYLLDMAKRDRREVLSRLTTLLTDLLRWDYRARKRSRRWAGNILHQRFEMQGLLDSPTLKNHAVQVLTRAYDRAVEYVSLETGRAKDQFSPTCPYTVDDLLSA